MSRYYHINYTPAYPLSFFFFNDTATTEIYTLSLHDALPISLPPRPPPVAHCVQDGRRTALAEDRLQRSAPAPASLLSCRPDPARSKCPARSEEHTSEPSH